MERISYDLHLHSCLSPCGDDEMTPGNIIGMASILGLDAVALTDHNTCKNCGVFLKLAEEYGLIALPGMELTTVEEVHVLFYFSNLEDAMAFDSYVEERMLPIPNRPKYFGNQILVDEEDEPCGTYDTLLISATEISFQDCFPLAERFHGIAVPAHIDKHSTSVLSNLGTIPKGSEFRLVESYLYEERELLKVKHPYLQSCYFLKSSDAHNLSSIQEPVYKLEVAQRSQEGLFEELKKRYRNGIVE